ncbi:hypothetical protein [Rhodococcus koreensis]
MGSCAVEQLWRTLSESGMALGCVRGPQSGWADLITVGDEAVRELTWLARETDEITEQYHQDPCGVAVL